MAEVLHPLAEQFGGKVVDFGDLSRIQKLALAWHMVVDRKAWDLPPSLADVTITADPREGGVTRETYKNLLRRQIPFYSRLYWFTRVGVVNVPMDAMLEAWAAATESDCFKDYGGDFEKYHAWYVSLGHIPDHDVSNPKKLWPVLLADPGDPEPIQDGWHRFHDYYRKRVKIVPCIFSVVEKKRTRKTGSVKKVCRA